MASFVHFNHRETIRNLDGLDKPRLQKLEIFFSSKNSTKNEEALDNSFNRDIIIGRSCR